MSSTRRRPPLSWKPRWVGKMYCSPACGAGCTREAYLLAHQRGRGLAARCGEGWTVRVHENIGWYYRAESPCKRLEVFENRLGHDYTCFLHEAGEFGGQQVGRGSTPRRAIADAVRKGLRARDAYITMLDGLDAYLT